MDVKKKKKIELVGRAKEKSISSFTFKPNKTMYHIYNIQTLQKQISLIIGNTRYSPNFVKKIVIL